MRARRILASWTLLLLAATGFAAEAGQPRLGRGTRVLSLHLSPDFEGPVGDTLDLSATFGRFVRDGLELRASADYALLEDVAGADSDYRSQGLDAGVDYHFRRASRLVPHAGLALGWRSTDFGDASDSGPTYGARAGLAWFLADNVALDLEIAYRLASADLFVNDFAREDRDLSTRLGFRVHF